MTWTKIALDIAVNNNICMYGWDCGPLTVKQMLKNRFEGSNPTYINAFTNILERAKEYYRKSLEKVLEALAEAVSELLRQWADAITKLELQKRLIV